MTKPNYEEFDRELLARVQAGCNKMMLLGQDASGLRALAEPHRALNAWGDKTPAYRIIDRRLQVLRKAGKLRWNGKVWEIAPKA